MQTTSLVHDSYMKLFTSPSLQFANRLQLLAYASRTLRGGVIETIREERVQLAGAASGPILLETPRQCWCLNHST